MPAATQGGENSETCEGCWRLSDFVDCVDEVYARVEDSPVQPVEAHPVALFLEKAASTGHA
jgi:hypothetical protein